MEILRIRHRWPEKAGFALNRPEGTDDYVLLHFHTPVRIWIGHQWQDTQPGAIIIFSPGTPHHFISSSPLVHDWAHLQGDIEKEIAPYHLQCNILYQPGFTPRISEWIAQIEAEFFARRDHWETVCHALFQQLWIHLDRNLSGQAPAPVPRETAERLRALREDMLLHPEWDWSNDGMARRLGLSVSRLYPLYRRMFSISPGQDLILMRIEKAKNLLLQGESVAHTAELMGYANLFHFIRQFKQIAGVTPGQFRG